MHRKRAFLWFSCPVVWFSYPVILTIMTVLASGCFSDQWPATPAPFLHSVTPDSITVSWFSPDTGISGVRFWPEGFPENVTTAIAPRPLPPWGRVSVKLNGLIPSTRYEYEVFSRTVQEEYVSPPGCFRTAPEGDGEPFFFMAYGDTQHETRHREVIDQMLKSPGAAFLLHCGDVVRRPSPDEWQKFFSAASPGLRNTPLYPSYGNHDDHNPELRQFFAFPGGRSWYSFNYGAAHVIAIDSNTDYRPQSEQYQWLINDLKAAEDRPWRIAFFHHPPYSPTSADNTEAVRKYLIPLFEAYGVSLVLNGHSHVYDRYTAGGIQYVITGGGGGWELTHETSDYDAPFHFVRVDVTLNALTVTAIRSDGSVADAFTIPRVQMENAGSGCAGRIWIGGSASQIGIGTTTSSACSNRSGWTISPATGTIRPSSSPGFIAFWP